MKAQLCMRPILTCLVFLPSATAPDEIMAAFSALQPNTAALPTAPPLQRTAGDTSMPDQR
jgi:hypothetical protein